MALSFPKVLVFAHSFVRRLHRDLMTQFDMRPALNFNLADVSIKLHGIGGQTVDKLLKYDFGYVQKFQPNIVIFEVGANDLPLMKPETASSKMDVLVHLLLGVTSIRVIGVCLVSDRAASPEFNTKVRILNQYLTVVFNGMHNFFVRAIRASLAHLFHHFYPMATILHADLNIVCTVATGVQYSKPYSYFKPEGLISPICQIIGGFALKFNLLHL
jgi:hypothetical protein